MQGEKFLRLSMTLSDSDFESAFRKIWSETKELFTEIKYVTTSEMAALKAQSEILKHKYYMSFITEDYYIYPGDFIFLAGVAFSLPRKQVVYSYNFSEDL